jgi:O-antigen/teichoic acid export membrane protein
MVAVLVVCATIATSREAIVMLASKKFQEAHVLLPFLVIGLVFSAVTIFFRPGLLIHNRASKVATATFLASALNIALNVVLLPRIGLVGAALSTMLSYAAIVIVLARESFKVLPFKLELGSLVRYVLAGLTAAWAASHVSVPAHLASIFLKGCVIAALYAVILWVIDQRARRLMRLAFGSAIAAVTQLKRPKSQSGSGVTAVIEKEAVLNR